MGVRRDAMDETHLVGGREILHVDPGLMSVHWEHAVAVAQPIETPWQLHTSRCSIRSSESRTSGSFHLAERIRCIGGWLEEGRLRYSLR